MKKIRISYKWYIDNSHVSEAVCTLRINRKHNTIGKIKLTMYRHVWSHIISLWRTKYQIFSHNSGELNS